jgi:guanylate cyclase soluble subunit beta
MFRSLKGQMIWIEEIRHMMYVSSPRLSSLAELMQLNIYLSDIPLYDVTRELILLNQQRIAEIDIA